MYMNEWFHYKTDSLVSFISWWRQQNGLWPSSYEYYLEKELWDKEFNRWVEKGSPDGEISPEEYFGEEMDNG